MLTIIAILALVAVFNLDMPIGLGILCTWIAACVISGWFTIVVIFAFDDFSPSRVEVEAATITLETGTCSQVLDWSDEVSAANEGAAFTGMIYNALVAPFDSISTTAYPSISQAEMETAINRACGGAS